MILIAMGVLIWTGELVTPQRRGQQFLDEFGLNFFQEI